MLEAPLVSIMIPTYNAPELLAKTMASAAAQDYGELEIVVCDNSTNEATAELMRSYASDPRVRYYRNSQARTKEENFAPFERLARGEYLQWLMHDDILLPGKISKMAAVLMENPAITLVTSERAVIGLDDREIAGSRQVYHFDFAGAGARFSGHDVGRLMLANLKNVIGEPSAALFRRRDLEHHYFHANVRGYYALSDVAMWLELLSKGDAYIFKQPLSAYRHYAGQEGSRVDVFFISRLEWYRLATEHYRERLFIDVDDYLGTLAILLDEYNTRPELHEYLDYINPELASAYQNMLARCEKWLNWPR